MRLFQDRILATMLFTIAFSSAPTLAVEPCDDSCVCTPIVLTFERDGFSFTSAEQGVLFDIDGDGFLEQISWVRARSEQAFLALDRNGNGQIDHGGELFGDAAEQAPSHAPNGFRALEWFDHPANGGNHDGYISRHDTVFSQLLLWFDDDHNGRSDPSELESLADRGVTAIDLDYTVSRRSDRHGNLLRWISSAHFEQLARKVVGDVIFVSLP